ncbi:MAG: phosphotransferase family protein [Dehalococcoidia bacterium]|nr:phosphotransferase family protein [Dehalococcoidia bacterium]
MQTEEVERGLAAFVQRNTGARAVRIENAARLSGGASRETWTWDADVEYDDRVERIPGILRANPTKDMPARAARELEYWVIRAAWESGAQVPEPLWDGDDTFDTVFMTMKRVDGETLGPRFIRGEQYAHAREVLPAQMARSLARIHAIDGSKYPQLAELPRPEPGAGPGEAALDGALQGFRLASRDPHPVFELAFRWLAQNMPPAIEPTFVHGDFRLGNLIFGEDGLRAVIDWELAHFGDPLEDLAWVMMRSWRFGGPKPVAGVGEREDFVRAYEAESGRTVDRTTLRWWEIFRTLHWGIITISQADTHLSGRVRSIELAAIGRRTAETEIEILNLLEGKY